MSNLAVKKYTLLEYLEMEEHSNVKHEYRNGWIYAMAGGTLNHGIIGNNVGTALSNALQPKKGKCFPINGDVKIYIESINESVYPDAMVICGDPSFKMKRKDMVTNPVLIIEVLSESTEAYDRGNKFHKYRQLPSFKEYVLISQDEPKVEAFYRHDASFWRISTAIGLDSSIHLYSIDCDIALKDIYAFLQFPGGVQGRLEL